MSQVGDMDGTNANSLASLAPLASRQQSQNFSTTYFAPLSCANVINIVRVEQTCL
jgi:hypothetical protein